MNKWWYITEKQVACDKIGNGYFLFATWKFGKIISKFVLSIACVCVCQSKIENELYFYTLVGCNIMDTYYVYFKHLRYCGVSACFLQI